MDKKKRNTLEKCSASTTDVEANTDLSSQNVENELEQVCPKKQKMQGKVDETFDLQTSSGKEEKTCLKKEIDDDEKEHDEDEKIAVKRDIVEMTNSLKEDDLLKLTPFKEKKEQEHGCCFETEGAFATNDRTIFVSGFDRSLARDDAKNILREYFSPYGPIYNVFVPMGCKTGALLGYAFINLIEYEKALKLDGSLMGEFKLHVVMAKTRGEYSSFPNFGGCKRCQYAHRKRRRDEWIETRGGRFFGPQRLKRPAT